MNAYQTEPVKGGVDGLILVALGLVAFMGYSLIQDLRRPDVEAAIAESVPVVQAAPEEPLTTAEPGLEEPPEMKADPALGDPDLIAAPYDKYTITQGPHGFSYGHMAIDIAAGKGAVIKSPINGTVTALYVDQWGNPTLVIENEIYQVTLMHGKYKVEVGQEVTLGQMVGKESNLGYTTDMRGVPCKNRNCGFHTHLNIFDKRLGVNINPLDVIGG